MSSAFPLNFSHLVEGDGSLKSRPSNPPPSHNVPLSEAGLPLMSFEEYLTSLAETIKVEAGDLLSRGNPKMSFLIKEITPEGIKALVLTSHSPQVEERVLGIVDLYDAVRMTKTDAKAAIRSVVSRYKAAQHQLALLEQWDKPLAALMEANDAVPVQSDN